MHMRWAVVGVMVVLAGCGLSVGTQGVHLPTPPSGPPVTAMTQTTPLTGEPFVPALSGHRLALAGDVAIVSDPEGPSEDGRAPLVHFASLSQAALLGAVQLPVGANPQAVAVASDGWAYVIAAGLGGVYAIDIANRVLGAFSATCPAPTDLAVRGADVLVTCRTGELVTLTHSGKSVQQLSARLMRVAVDASSRVFVATDDARIIEVGGPTAVPGAVPLPDMRTTGQGRVEHANTPRRLMPLPSGGVAMLYQQSVSGELETLDPTGQPLPPTMGGTGGGDPGMGGGTQDGQSPYSGGGDCAVPAARPAYATMNGDGQLGAQHWSLSTLAVDGAVSEDGTTLAVADAAGGKVRLETLAGQFVSGDDTCFAMPQKFDDMNGGSAPFIEAGTPSAVAFSGTTLVVLSSDPVLELMTVPAGATTPLAKHITLRSRVISEGFRLFHTDPHRSSGSTTTTPVVDGFGSLSNGSLACASCHPDGLSNGATTTINGVIRRVMPLAGHLKTASLVHWEAKSFHEAVVEGTWHTNMGGQDLSAAQEASLRDFIGQLQLPGRAPLAASELNDGAVAFTKAGCGGCHIPSLGFTNDSVADVGRGLHKVPSLLGLAFTAPYMSDGCAQTIEARFDNAACGGGASHGNVAALNSVERSALIAYLKSL